MSILLSLNNKKKCPDILNYQQLKNPPNENSVWLNNETVFY